jgi:hypothetical protein
VPVPVYSSRLVAKHNFAGNFNFLNDTGDLLIIRTVTLFYGGATPGAFFFEDELGGTMLFHYFGGTLTGDTNQNILWTNLHLCMADGLTWDLAPNIGMDFSVHGYQLSLP